MKYLVTVHILLILSSCQPLDMKQKAIASKKETRKSLGLLPVDDNLKLDSTKKLTPNDPNFVYVYDHLTNNKNSKTLFSIDYFSDDKKNLNKSIFYKNENEEFEIVREEDYYNMGEDQTGKSYLLFSYDFKRNEKSFRIDSFPSDKLRRTNIEKLERALIEAENANAEICGTSQNKILVKGFPTRHTFIKEKEFNVRRKQFLTFKHR